MLQKRYSEEFKRNKIVPEYEYYTADTRQMLDYQGHTLQNYDQTNQGKDSSSNQNEGLASLRNESHGQSQTPT